MEEYKSEKRLDVQTAIAALAQIIVIYAALAYYAGAAQRYAIAFHYGVEPHLVSRSVTEYIVQGTGLLLHRTALITSVAITLVIVLTYKRCSAKFNWFRHNYIKLLILLGCVLFITKYPNWAGRRSGDNVAASIDNNIKEGCNQFCFDYTVSGKIFMGRLLSQNYQRTEIVSASGLRVFKTEDLTAVSAMSKVSRANFWRELAVVQKGSSEGGERQFDRGRAPAESQTTVLPQKMGSWRAEGKTMCRRNTEGR